MATTRSDDRVGVFTGLGWIFDHPNFQTLNKLEFKVLMALFLHVDVETGHCWPSLRRIARLADSLRVGNRRKKSGEVERVVKVDRVSKALKSLEKKGFTKTVNPGDCQTSTVRQLLPFGGVASPKTPSGTRGRSSARVSNKKRKGSPRHGDGTTPHRGDQGTPRKKGEGTPHRGDQNRTENRPKEQTKEQTRADLSSSPSLSSVSAKKKIRRYFGEVGLSKKEQRQALDAVEKEQLWNICRLVNQMEETGKLRKEPLAMLRHFLKDPWTVNLSSLDKERKPRLRRARLEDDDVPRTRRERQRESAPRSSREEVLRQLIDGRCPAGFSDEQLLELGEEDLDELPGHVVGEIQMRLC